MFNFYNTIPWGDTAEKKTYNARGGGVHQNKENLIKALNYEY